MQDLRARRRGVHTTGRDQSQRHAGDGGLDHDRKHVVGAGTQRKHRGVTESGRGRSHSAVTAEQRHRGRASLGHHPGILGGVRCGPGRLRQGQEVDLGQPHAGGRRAARSRRTSRSTPAAIPKVSVDNSTRSTPSAPTARMIRAIPSMSFRCSGRPTLARRRVEISLPDIGFGIIPTALPGTTGVGCLATVSSCTSSVDRLVRSADYSEYVTLITSVKRCRELHASWPW